MKIENSLDLSIPPEDAWHLLLDIPFVAPCLPGAELTKVIDERTFEGLVRLKLGPISLSFKGSAVIEEVDPATKSVIVSAKGREERGRGSAHATINFHIGEAAGNTRVTVVTDLNLAGSIVQYARGVGIVTKTAQQLVDQFAERLTARLESGETPDAEAIKVGSILWKGLKAGLSKDKKPSPDKAE